MHQEASIPKTFVALIFWYKMLTLFSGNTNRNSGKGFLASHPFLAHLLSKMARLALLAMRSQRILMSPLTACPVVAFMLVHVEACCHILSFSPTFSHIVVFPHIFRFCRTPTVSLALSRPHVPAGICVFSLNFTMRLTHGVILLSYDCHMIIICCHISVICCHMIVI